MREDIRLNYLRKTKLLIIRFSSFGDIVQAISVPYHFAENNPNSEVHWLVREDYAEILEPQTTIANVIPFSRNLGLLGILSLAWKLAGKGYTHVYDAHNNLRSNIVVAVFYIRKLVSIFGGPGKFLFLQRPKHRIKRFFLFNFHINKFENPFIASFSYLEPLTKWGIGYSSRNLLGLNRFLVSSEAREKANSVLRELSLEPLSFITLVPSAAWKMKRWPVAHWRQLVKNCPDQKFIILGGPKDRFCKDIAAVAPDRVFNLCGELTLIESCAMIEISRKVISGDTGLLHVADQMQISTIALIGPTAFGYPASPRSISLHRNLDCQPCSKDGRGQCRNKVYQKCMVDIRPEYVIHKTFEDGVL